MYTDAELELTRERNLKYQGTAKISLDQIIPHPSIFREFDSKNVERLCEIFNRDGCRRFDLRNHITATVSRQHLYDALRAARVSPQALMTSRSDQHPRLQFPTGNVQCLHGQHRLRAAAELLPASDQWWTVDLYLDGNDTLFLSYLCNSDILPTADISPGLQATLIDEYSNEKTPSDGEVYRKVRQYEHEANAQFKKRWMARLSANKAKRFRQLSSHEEVCAAFDALLEIPALLVHGMQFGSLPDALASNCDEVCIFRSTLSVI